MPGQFGWFDVTTTEPDRVREFYAGLFDWPVAPEANAGRYRGWITDGEQPWAGVVQAEPATDGPAGTSVTIADPAGAQLALFKPFA